VATGRDDRGRPVITGSAFSMTTSNTEKAAFIPATQTHRTVRTAPGVRPNEIEVVFDVRGSGDFVWSIRGAAGQDAFTLSQQQGERAVIQGGRARLTLTGVQNDSYRNGRIQISLQDGDSPRSPTFYSPTVTVEITGSRVERNTTQR